MILRCILPKFLISVSFSFQRVLPFSNLGCIRLPTYHKEHGTQHFFSSNSDGIEARKYRLLLIDDEAPLRKAVGSYLTQKGYDVETKEDGMQALAYLNDPGNVYPDVIISDITMPGMDGYQLLQRLKSFPTLRYIPIIMLTARGMTQDRIAGYRAGANAYLPKPFDPEELVSIIDNLILSKHGASSDMADLKRELNDIKSLLTSNAVPTQNTVWGVNGASSASNGRTDEKLNKAGNNWDMSLTLKEQQVLNLLCRGFTNRETAEELDTSIRNVEKHVTKLLDKTGTANRTELVKFALVSGLRTG